MYANLKKLAQEKRQQAKTSQILNENALIQLRGLFGELKMLPAAGEPGSECDKNIFTTLGDFKLIKPITYYSYRGQKLTYLVRSQVDANDHPQNHQSQNFHNGNLNKSPNLSVWPQKLHEILIPVPSKLEQDKYRQSQEIRRSLSKPEQRPKTTDYPAPLILDRNKHQQESRLSQQTKSVSSIQSKKKKVENTEKIFDIADLLKTMINPYATKKPTNGNNEKRFIKPNNENRFIKPNNENRFIKPNNENRFIKPINKNIPPTIEKSNTKCAIPRIQLIPARPITKQQLCMDLEMSDSEDEGIDMPNIENTDKNSQYSTKKSSNNGDRSIESGFESSPETATLTPSTTQVPTLKCSIDLSRLARIPTKIKDTSIRCSIDLSRLPGIRNKLKTKIINGSLQRKRIC